MKLNELLEPQVTEFKNSILELRRASQKFSDAHEEYIFLNYKDAGILKALIKEKLIRTIK